MPTLARLQDKYAGDDFAMVIVSQDHGGWKVIERFMNRLKLDADERRRDRDDGDPDRMN